MTAANPLAGAAATTRRDCAVLALLLLGATLTYLPGLGFYSDDGALLRAMQLGGDSFVAVGRPGQGIPVF
jgi:hypothetical protein